MKITKLCVAIVAAATLHSTVASAQIMFRTTLRANCRSLGSNGKLVTTHLTDRDIISQAVGGSTGTGTNSVTRNFALVYNPTSDSLQVVNSAGTVISDVIQFQGGAFTSDSKQSVRLTFMFLPNETDSIGTAVITE